MNVFKKINSSNIFATQKKKTTAQIPLSAQKLDIRQQDCYYLLDYQLRGDGLLICRISKNKMLINMTESKRTVSQIIQCTIRQKVKIKDLWIGKKYMLVNMQTLLEPQSQTQEIMMKKAVADTLQLINNEVQTYKEHKSKRN